MTVKMPTSLSSGSIVVDKSLLEHLLPALKASPVRSGPGSWKCLLPLFGHVIHNWACTNKTHSVMIAHTVPLVQVSSQCPEGGERACRFCLSNEITSHSGPVHQKTQRDQCRTAGLQRVAAWSRRHRWAGLLRKTVEIHPQWIFFCCCYWLFFSDSSNRSQRLHVWSEDIIYNVSIHCWIAGSEILIQSLYEAFGNGMCFIIHESLKIKLQP